MSIEIIYDQDDGSVIREFTSSRETAISIHPDLADYFEHTTQPDLPDSMKYQPRKDFSVLDALKLATKLRPTIQDRKIGFRVKS
jgi:hypothetical protein